LGRNLCLCHTSRHRQSDDAERPTRASVHPQSPMLLKMYFSIRERFLGSRGGGAMQFNSSPHHRF
jgi:hypothetical protein